MRPRKLSKHDVALLDGRANIICPYSSLHRTTRLLGSGIRSELTESHRNSTMSKGSQTNLARIFSGIYPKTDRNSPNSVGTEFFPKLNPKTSGDNLSVRSNFAARFFRQ